MAPPTVHLPHVFLAEISKLSMKKLTVFFRFAGCYNLVRNQERPFPIDIEKKEQRRWDYYYKLESESSPDDSEGSESTLSIQGKETGTNVLVLQLDFLFRTYVSLTRRHYNY